MESGILWLYISQCLLVRQRIKQLMLVYSMPKKQFCCSGLTLSERKMSTSTSQLETEIIFNLLCLTADPGFVSP